MSLSIADSGIRLAVLCIVMALVATLVYRFTSLGSVRVVPGALARGALQLAAISLILAAALAHIWSALLVLVGMFAAASFTAARRCGAGTSGAWLTIALASGIGVVLPLMLLSGVVPLEGIALVPIGGIVLGGAMTATSMAAKRGLDAVDDRYGEVEAALSLGFSQRDARWEVARTAASDALLPGVDQTRTVGLVTLPGAFVGVLLATGSAVQAGAVQILVLAGLLLAQTCSVAVALEFVARGFVFRGKTVRPARVR
ncbi:ABC transporter permease [Rhodococcus sp. WS1]|uniref:ABC transporter permease n=1 Tax=unclassified Rhodococcus (in: high G+C Gram-positive bacteria) TaxID=192944 RepID=UPI001144095C|nr:MULTISPECIES: ABC transporter permease [unclassified Rhodococcus (in: high G+C Gram-positive bacteria)]ROZ56191.1 ABC transporter permease [Rhodococcus sp. WS1]TQC40385.1 ABC transporter permease [Rhodococcus sp. WS7]